MVDMAVDSSGLDRIDSEILSILRDDARIPYQTLGDRVHLSANAAAAGPLKVDPTGFGCRFHHLFGIIPASDGAFMLWIDK